MKHAPLLAAMGVTKYHVLNPQGDARCGSDVESYGSIPARSVEEHHRCRSAPCKAKWPANLRAVG